MRAVVYSAPRQFSVTGVETPEPGPGQVRVHIELAGVCGTDRHIHDGDFFAAFPLTPGHEPVGTVDALGDGVAGLRVGQRVAVNGVGGCGACRFCQRGASLHCVDLTALGVTGPGGFAEYMVAPAPWCYPADELSPEVAVFAEPTACAIHGATIAAPQPGSDALVFGAGPTGLILAQLLAHGGAARVTVAAPTRFKLELARAFGIDGTVVMPREDPQAALRELRDRAPDGYDVVVDATGAPSIAQECVPLTRSGGTVLFYGVTSPDDRVSVSPFDIYRREISVKGSFAQNHSFAPALAALRSGRVRTDGLITHRYALGDFGQALDALGNDPTAHKIVMVPRE